MISGSQNSLLYSSYIPKATCQVLTFLSLCLTDLFVQGDQSFQHLVLKVYLGEKKQWTGVCSGEDYKQLCNFQFKMFILQYVHSLKT